VDIYLLVILVYLRIRHVKINMDTRHRVIILGGVIVCLDMFGIVQVILVYLKIKHVRINMGTWHSLIILADAAVCLGMYGIVQEPRV